SQRISTNGCMSDRHSLLTPSMAGTPISQNFTTSTSSRAHTKPTREQMYFLKGQSSSKSYSSRCQLRILMVREPSLRGGGYFPGPWNGADATVKDSKRYADTRGWGYYNFNHHEPKAPTAKVRAKEECAYCHIANAKKDEVWTQFYPLLDK